MPQPDHSALLIDAARIAERLVAWVPAWRGADPRRLTLHQSRRRISRQTEEAGAPYLGAAYAWPDDDDRPWLVVQAHSRGTSAAAARAAGALHLPEIDAVAWLLPSDPALDMLPRVLDPAQVASRLSSFSARGVASGSLAAQRPRIVRYEPGSHCTVRVTLQDEAGVRVVYGKCHADARWKINAAHLMALWPRGEAQPDAFAVARPLGACADWRMLWQHAVHGVPLRAVLHDERAIEVQSVRLMRGLRRLQAMPLLGHDRLDPATVFARTMKQAKKLQRAEPDLTPTVEAAVARLQRMPAPATLVNVHGDFHVDQLMQDGSRLVLFDFDNLACGHPACDVADFASQLLTDRAIEPVRRRALAGRLIAVAREVLSGRLRDDDLQWHLRALLLRKAYSFFVRHGADWRVRAREAIALAEQGLAALDDANRRLGCAQQAAA